MITFMEWVNLAEKVRSIFARALTESKLRGDPINFNRVAADFVDVMQQTIEEDPDLPDPLKQAAAELRDQPELKPEVLGGKLRGSLKGASPNDQEDIIQDAIMNFMIYLRKHKFANFAHVNEPVVPPEELAGYITGNFQKKARQTLITFYRQRGRRPPTVTDVAGDDDGSRPEASYEDEGEGEALKKSGVDITPRSWNTGIKVLMNVRTKVNEDITARATAKPKKTTTSQEKWVKLLDTSLALMRNMPHQMAQQLNFKDVESGMSGDEQIYMRLKSMIEDDTSDIHPDDRAMLATWASHDKSKEYQIRQPKQCIAAALWVGSGMIASQKPAILRGGNEKTFPEDNWFFQIVTQHDIDPDEFEGGDDSELYRKPVEPVAKPQERIPPTSASTATPTATRPPMKPRPKPVITEKPTQRGLFDDEE